MPVSLSFSILHEGRRRNGLFVASTREKLSPSSGISPPSPVFLLTYTDRSFSLPPLPHPFRRRCSSIFLRVFFVLFAPSRVRVPSFLPFFLVSFLRPSIADISLLLTFPSSQRTPRVHGTSPRLPTHNRHRLPSGTQPERKSCREGNPLPGRASSSPRTDGRARAIDRIFSIFSSNVVSSFFLPSRAIVRRIFSFAAIHDRRGATLACASHILRRTTPRILGLGRIVSVTPWVVTSRPTIPVAR